MADFVQEGDRIDYTPTAAVAAGDVVQVDSRAGVATSAIAAGALGSLQTCGIYTVAKTTGVVVLTGAELWWDVSAAKAILRPAGGGSDVDFFLGTATADATSAATTCKVDLNRKPSYIFNVHDDGFATALVLTAGTPSLTGGGGTLAAAFSLTAEAQKIDILSRRSFPVTSNWIMEAVVCVRANADADVADLNIGVANGTHASDAGTITESCFVHLDMGADLNIDAESDDGTTEVNATDTTIDWAVGTPFRVTIDGRDESDIQIYINGALVLTDTVFKLNLATGPLKALIHLAKSANDSPGTVDIDEMTVRLT